MAATTGERPPSSHHPEHEAVLAGVMALASLFSNCVEAFGLIHATHKWEKEEQYLLTQLGIQQARLLIWGDVVGVTSPPRSVTDRAVPKHPSAAYPDLKEPTFFGTRDARLDEPESRTEIEAALGALVDRAATATRDDMMAKYGLKAPKRLSTEHQPALDTNRLEALREHYELLKEVAETYAQINTRRTHSMVQTSWNIVDAHRFGQFLHLTQEKIDFLINFMGVKEAVDRGMRMDIRAIGWHLTADRARVAADVSKLRLIREYCQVQYPEYLEATQIALDNIEREKRENVGGYNPYMPASAQQPSAPPAVKPYTIYTKPKSPPHASHTANGAEHDKHKRPGLLGGIFKFGRSKSHQHSGHRSQSVSGAGNTSTSEDTPRANSDVGPARSSSQDSGRLEPVRSKSVGAAPHPGEDDEEDSGWIEPPMEKIRSKSIGAVLDVHPDPEGDEDVRTRLEKLATNVTVPDTVAEQDDEYALRTAQTIDSTISRHDQYHGLGRQGTKNQ